MLHFTRSPSIRKAIDDVLKLTPYLPQTSSTIHVNGVPMNAGDILIELAHREQQHAEQRDRLLATLNEIEGMCDIRKITTCTNSMREELEA